MPFRIEVALACEVLAVIGTLIRPDWGLILLVFLTFARPQDDRPNLERLHIQGALTWAVLAATALRPAVVAQRIGFALRELRLFVALFVLMCASAVVNGLTVYSSEQLNDSFTVLIVCTLILIWISDQKRLTIMASVLLGAGLYYVQMVVRDPTYMRVGEFDRIIFRNLTNFGNPNFLALLMVILTFWTLGVVGAVRKSWIKIGLLGAVAGFMFAFLKCQSRGGTLALAASLLVFCILHWRKPLFLSAIGTGLVLSIVFLAPSTYLSRLQTIINYQGDKSAETRLEMWSNSIRMIESNPLFGIGPGNFGPRFPHGMTEHEAYLQTASELGLPALLVYVALLVGGCHSAWKARTAAARKGTDSSFLVGASNGSICGVVAIAVAGFFTGLAFREFVYITVALTFTLRELAEEVSCTPSREVELSTEPDLDAGLSLAWELDEPLAPAVSEEREPDIGYQHEV